MAGHHFRLRTDAGASVTTVTRLYVGPETGADAGADERRLGLLRQIAKGGGTITPNTNPQSVRGYEYPALSDEAERDLLFLAERNYLEARFFDRVSLCPKCASHHLNVREICPGCRRSHLSSEGLLHHFRCGNVGIPSEFAATEDGGYICPKCNRTMRHLGTEYDRLGKAFVCHGCGRVSDNPPVEAVCLACGARTSADDLVSTEVFSYVLTSRGSEAIHRGSLLTGGDDDVSIADAPVYRRSVTLEFLDHEMKRLQHFSRGFSVLLVECAATAIDGQGDESPTHWLRRLRGCLREIDVMGQMADALYVVILPQTRRRAAEALCQRITAELGPQSPLTLSAIPISEPRHLPAVLARRAVPGGKS